MIYSHLNLQVLRQINFPKNLLVSLLELLLKVFFETKLKKLLLHDLVKISIPSQIIDQSMY